MLEKNTEVIGKLLYTKYVFPFEVVSVLLLVALIGAISLVMREKWK
jgi:NADH-quinone oxidoreductase subunit J